MKPWIVLVFTLMTSCVASPAMADDSFILHVGGWSKHWSSSENVTNENHKVLAGEYKGVLAGYFENSYGQDGAMLLKTWRWNVSENIQTSAGVGVNYSYTTCYGDDGSGKNICPDGYVGVGYTKYMIVPSVKVKPGVAVFTTEIHF